jgi:hypothetical protein
MRSAADIASELDEGLKQLFDAGLELCLEIQAEAKAAERDEKARLGLAFHRISRGVRQTAALRMRLAHEAERAGRETAAEVIKLDQRRLEKRKAHVKAAVEGLIWTEAESPEAAERLDSDFEDLLEIETQDAETFEAEPLDEQIQRLAWVIGLKVPPPQEEVSAKPTQRASPQTSQPPVLSGSPLSPGVYPRAALWPDPGGTAPPTGEQLGRGPDHPFRASG